MPLPVQYIPKTLFLISTQIDWHLSKSSIAYINRHYGLTTLAKFIYPGDDKNISHALSGFYAKTV